MGGGPRGLWFGCLEFRVAGFRISKLSDAGVWEPALNLTGFLKQAGNVRGGRFELLVLKGPGRGGGENKVF